MFSQLLDFLDRNDFNYLARKYGGDKYVKQHIKIKKFWGNSENAVRIQIYSAIISYCMMAIVQKKMGVSRSIYEMLQIVSISLTDIAPLKDLFGKPNCNNVNERVGSTELGLFDCLTFMPQKSKPGLFRTTQKTNHT